MSGIPGHGWCIVGIVVVVVGWTVVVVDVDDSGTDEIVVGIVVEVAAVVAVVVDVGWSHHGLSTPARSSRWHTRSSIVGAVDCAAT